MDGFSLHLDWQNARENARQAIEESRREGVMAAEAEGDYYRTKAIVYAELLQAHPATAAAAMVKGDERVNSALVRFRAAQAVHKAAQSAAQLFINEETHCFKEYQRAIAGEREN